MTSATAHKSEYQGKTPNKDARTSEDEVAAITTYRLGIFSYEMEISRYDSLLSTLSHLMTYVSIESIALITLLPTLLQYTTLPEVHIAICYSVVFSLLLATLCVALYARFRFAYISLRSPKTLGEYVSDNESYFTSEIKGSVFFCKSIEESYLSIRDRNDRISRLANFATVLALFSIVALVVAAISLVSAFPYL